MPFYVTIICYIRFTRYDPTMKFSSCIHAHYLVHVSILIIIVIVIIVIIVIVVVVIRVNGANNIH